MKNILKYNVLPRCLTLLLALVLAVSATVLPAAAAAESYTEWVYDTADGTLTATFPGGSEMTFIPYESHPRLRFDPYYTYKYYNTVRIDGTLYDVYSADEKTGVLALMSADGEQRFFVTEDQKQEFDSILEGSGVHKTSLSVWEGDGYRHYDMDKGFLRKLNNLKQDSLTETLTEALSELRYAPRYELWIYDADSFLAINSGFLLDLAGEMYYLNIHELPAAALDENAMLIPSESVTVTLYRLPEDMAEDTYNAVRRAYLPIGWGFTQYEEDTVGDILDDNAPAAFVYLTVGLLGIAVPIAPLVLGLCLPHSRKQGYKKRWYLLTAFGGAWMLLGILVLVMMIVAL